MDLGRDPDIVLRDNSPAVLELGRDDCRGAIHFVGQLEVHPRARLDVARVVRIFIAVCFERAGIGAVEAHCGQVLDGELDLQTGRRFGNAANRSVRGPDLQVRRVHVIETDAVLFAQVPDGVQRRMGQEA